MIPPEGQTIIELVRQGQYRKALGVSAEASSAEVNKAHIRLLYKFREYPEVKEALNEAKVKLPKPEPKPEKPHVPPQGFFTVLARIIISWPIRLLAMVGTALVLWRLYNIFLTLVVFAVSFLFIKAVRKSDSQSGTNIMPLLIFFMWSGFSVSVYIALGKLIPTWSTRMILGVIAGLGVTIYLGRPLLEAMMQKLSKPGLWKCAGIFCVLFMSTFGLTNLFFMGTQNIKTEQIDVQAIQSISQPPLIKTTPTPVRITIPLTKILLSEDFESGIQNWKLGEGWNLVRIDNNTVLKGRGHKWAWLKNKPIWDYYATWHNYAFKAKFKQIQGTIHFNYRHSDRTDGLHRYFIGVRSNDLYLTKQIGEEYYELAWASLKLKSGWHEIEIRGYENIINVYIDDKVYIVYKDSTPVLFGSIAFETLAGAEFEIDDVEVMIINAEDVVDEPTHSASTWLRLV